MTILNINIFAFVVALTIVSCENSSGYANEKKVDVKKVEDKLVKQNFTFLNLVEIWKVDGSSQFNLIKKIDDFEFTSIYKPYSILAMEEIEGINMDDTISPSFYSKANSYSKMHYFNFNIKNDKFKNELIKMDVEDNQGYYDRITYYSFNSKNDVFVIEDNDTLKCDFVNFERTYEANPSIMLTFAFTRKSTQIKFKTLKLVFEDKIFNKGKLIFNYETPPILLLNNLKPLS